jgi:alpha-L-rhamnosidase
MRIRALRVNHMENPIGYRMERTVFSWKVDEAKGTRQDAAQILVYADRACRELIYDSTLRPELDSIGTELPIPLRPRTRYFWRVIVESDAGERAESELAFFETGKRDEPWQATWIGCQSADSRHPLFQKTISLTGELAAARLYICGLGLYEAYLNDRKIGDEYLTPHYNDYDRWLQTDTYDVTAQLNDRATLSVLLGNGWYKGRFSFFENDTAGKYGQDFRLIAELHLDYTDGRHEVIGTDESWDVGASHITFSGIYDGEHRDDTLPPLSLGKACRLPAPPAPLTDRMSVPVRAYREWKPTALIHTPAGETVLDLGQNFSGIFRLQVNEARGQTTRLQFGELLQGGNFYRDNLRTAKAEYVYISGGEPVELTPHFTFYGYRYVKLEGISDLQPEDFTAVGLSSCESQIGSVETGHALVNRLIENARWGLLSNSLDVPTDCPQRDERLGWTGDAQVFSSTALSLYDLHAFYAKYLYDMAREQEAQDGCVPNYIPSQGASACSAAWGDAACIIPWNLYETYGDPSILADSYDSMKVWVEYIRRVDAEDHGWSRAEHFGDWLALDHESGDANENSGATDKGFIAQVYYMQSAEILSKSASVLGKADDAANYGALAARLRDHIQFEYFSGSGRCCVNTQTAYLLALRHGLSVDEDYIRQRLRELFFFKSDKLLTGFVGTPLALPTLSEHGMGGLAAKLLLNEDYPGWLYAVKLGATTIWERWDSLLADGSISGTGMNSLNHYAYGSVVEWIIRYAGGLRQAVGSVGYRRVLVAPELNWQLRWMRTEFDSPVGRYVISWELTTPRHVTLRVSVPFGGEALVRLPDSADKTEKQLGAGEYEFSYETVRPLKPELSASSPISALYENEKIKAMILARLPELQVLKKSMWDHPLDQLLLAVAGFVGLPDREIMAQEVIPYLAREIRRLDTE